MNAITYILQIDGPEMLVKVGRTANVKSRMATLKTGLPWPARIVALIGTDVEHHLKTMLAEYRVQGEWFRPSERLSNWLAVACDEGQLVKQMTVDQAYVNAVIKPRIREYLEGREPINNASGDLVRLILADLCPTIAGREKDLFAATKGHVTIAMCRGYGPCNERPHLAMPDTAARPDTAAAA